MLGLAFCFNAIELISLERYTPPLPPIETDHLSQLFMEGGMFPVTCFQRIHAIVIFVFSFLYSVSVGCLLLGGLFLYDIFWVCSMIHLLSIYHEWYMKILLRSCVL